MKVALSNGIDLQSPEYRLEAIPLMFNRHNVVVSKATDAKRVGGRGKLGKLTEQGKIRV